jgi:hypothetical protein
MKRLFCGAVRPGEISCADELLKDSLKPQQAQAQSWSESETCVARVVFALMICFLPTTT